MKARVAVVVVVMGWCLGLLFGCARLLPLDARIAILGAETGPIPFTVRFSSAGSAGRVDAVAWDFGDPGSGEANTSTAVAPTHTYTEHGAYLVTLTVYTNDGRSDRATLVLYATNPPPVAEFAVTPVRGSAPLSVIFDLSASQDPASLIPVPSGTIVSYSLDFGDGSTPVVGQDLSLPVAHVYASAGVRTATLHVVDDDGAVGSAWRQIVVEGIVATLSAPGPDPTGLAYDGAWLWISDASTRRIYKVRPADGYVLSSFDAPGSSAVPSADAKSIIPVPNPVGVPAGLALGQGSLWVACASDGRIYKLHPDLPTTDPNHVQGVLDSEEFTPFGLAFGGGSLWVSDLVRGRVFRVDPMTGAVQGSFAAPAVGPTDLAPRGIVAVAPTGLAWAGGALWVTAGPVLAKVNPWTGVVLDTTAAPGLEPADLAYDGQFLWVADPNGTAPGALHRVVAP
ncbi:MAG: PKD domain-containing protein [Candidatus Bipolaricaulota bacterium]